MNIQEIKSDPNLTFLYKRICALNSALDTMAKIGPTSEFLESELDSLIDDLKIKTGYEYKIGEYK